MTLPVETSGGIPRENPLQGSVSRVIIVCVDACKPVHSGAFWDSTGTVRASVASRGAASFVKNADCLNLTGKQENYALAA